MNAGTMAEQRQYIRDNTGVTRISMIEAGDSVGRFEEIQEMPFEQAREELAQECNGKTDQELGEMWGVTFHNVKRLRYKLGIQKSTSGQVILKAMGARDEEKKSKKRLVANTDSLDPDKKPIMMEVDDSTKEESSKEDTEAKMREEIARQVNQMMRGRPAVVSAPIQEEEEPDRKSSLQIKISGDFNADNLIQKIEAITHFVVASSDMSMFTMNMVIEQYDIEPEQEKVSNGRQDDSGSDNDLSQSPTTPKTDETEENDVFGHQEAKNL